MAHPNTYDRLIAVGVDMENDFFPPSGSLAVTDGDQVVQPFNSVAHWVRERGGSVVFTRDYHPPVTDHFSDEPDFVNTWPAHGVAGKYGSEFHSDLQIEPTDFIINKGTKVNEAAYSGFEGETEEGITLETIVIPRNFESVAVLIGGLATDYCDKATALGAIELARRDTVAGVLDVYALTDAMKPVNPVSGEAALREMEAAGVRLTTTQEVINNQIISLS